MRALVSLVLAGGLGAPAVQAEPKAPQAAAPVEYAYDARAVFPLVAAPGRVTDILLEAGEQLVAANPIAAGDTARWIIGGTSSGEGGERRVHVLVKPTAQHLETNLVINTNRRTYFLALRASGRGFLTQVRWRYPQTVIAPFVAAPPAPPQSQPAPRALHFGYRIKGRGAFRPVRVWDDGHSTYLAFRTDALAGDLPPLFLVGADGKAIELVNYRLEGRTVVVDRLFAAAELRLGQGRLARRVRIERAAPEARS